MTSPLPTRQAGECVLPDGETVWIQTVNTIQREDAFEAADIWAELQTRTYKKGNPGWEAVWSKFEDREPEHQAAYLADTAVLLGDLSADVEDPHTDPNLPTRGEMDNDKWAAAMETYEADCKKAKEGRQKALERFYKEQKKRAEALSAKVRLERCVKAYRDRKVREVFTSRFLLEILRRAVRKNDDRLVARYDSIEQVSNLDDAVREKLIERYFEIDNVSPADIPTTPADS